MASTAAPYGLKPFNKIGSVANPQATRLIKIASGYAADIFVGQVVCIASDGTIQVVTNVGSNADAFPAGVIGVFMGCQYTDPTLKYLLFSQKWPSGTVASDAYAMVNDDPNQLYMAQAAGSLAQTALGQNCYFNAAQSGNATTGVSTTAISTTTAATSTVAFRIVDFVSGPTSAVGDAYTDLVIKFNAGIHSYTNATGI